MKKFLRLIFISLFCFTSPLLAANYYWVGGTGTWSDYAAHWATSSGGTVFHVTIPNPNDDVFFDANSFPTTGDTVYMDSTITNCRGMDWGAVTNAPVFKGTGIKLYLYGSLILNPAMTWTAGGSIYFGATATGNVINTGGTPLGNSTSLSFQGSGTWDLQNDIDVGNYYYQSDIYLSFGTLNTHGYSIRCGNFNVGGNASLYLDTSFVDCYGWLASGLSGVLDADSARFQCASSFYGGSAHAYVDVTCGGLDNTDNCTFNDVVTNSFYSGCYLNTFHNVLLNGSMFYGSGNSFNKMTTASANINIHGSSQADTIIFNNPGQVITINDADTVTVNNFLLADGTCNGLTTIKSTGTGYISMPSGTTTLNYMLLQNISAVGGAAFIANNSVDAGNVTGFTINTPAPQNLYWVGGTGNWDDMNHWSSSSGGAGGSCVPNQFDNVFFDANSFPGPNDTVYSINTATYCVTMDWSAATNSPVFKGTGIKLYLYGSLILNPAMTWSAGGNIYFGATATGNVINTGGTALGNSTSLSFQGSGTWDLQNNLDVGNYYYQSDIYLSFGTLNSHGYSIRCGNFNVGGNASLYLDTSFVDCYGWLASGLSGVLDADSARFQCASSFYGGSVHAYADVNCGGLDNTDNCTFNDVVTNSFYSGCYLNTFHNVLLNGSMFYGSRNSFNKVTTASANINIHGSSQADTIIFNNPGQVITINDADTVTVNNFLLADGTCNGLTTIKSTGTGYISMPSGTTTLNYMLLQNISAVGGAAFIANNSVDAGNVTGFTINTPAPQNLYWVGGTGNWDDMNHWSSSSGGAGGSCVPNQFDNVFFDANSFPGPNDTVYSINTATYCVTMDWSATTNSPVFKGTGIKLYLYGSLILNPAMTWSAGGNIYFGATATGNVINTGGTALGNSTSLSFQGSGTWDLQNNLDVGNYYYQSDIYLSFGTLNSHGYSIRCGNFNVGGNASLYLDTSFVDCYGWLASGLSGVLDADSARFQCASSFYGGSVHAYADVNCGGLDNTDNCTFNDVVTNSFYSGCYLNTFHNVLLNGSMFYGSGNSFNKMTTASANINIHGSSQADTIIFNNPGQVITINDGDTITINNFLLIQSDPGFPTSIQCNTGTGFISKPTDTVCTDYIYMKNITATGGAVYFAGDHSVDLGGNSGWNWVRCAPLISNVWPGDCNYDLITDNFDLLNIGVSYGDTGYIRPGASMAYTAQPCQDWYYQFINAVNVKHADCNGNGIVDANDSTAIALNYGLTHPARLIQQVENNSIGTELAFVLPPVVVPGASLSVPITLGTSLDPAANVYGIAFTVDYDPAFIQAGTMSVDYTSSWVENAGNHLHLEKDFPGGGQTDVAFTRIDQGDVSGYGLIATLNFTVSPSADGTFNLSFSHVKVISHNEIEIPIQTGTSSTWVDIGDPGIEITTSVFPNPMTDQAQVIFSNPSHETWTFSMKDVTGRIVRTEESLNGNSVLIEKKNLGSGVYFYTLRNAEGKTANGKLVVK